MWFKKCRQYNKSHISFAREMRKRPTIAENKMRQSFLRYRPAGYKFTRQKPMWPFILDFYCAKLSLAIEVDGEIHKIKQEYDHQRTLYLNELWITVVRYTNDEVIENLDWVAKHLIQTLEELEQQSH